MRRIVRYVERGMPLTLAADAAGIAPQTLFNYRSERPRFAAALARAIGRGVEARLKRIEDASNAGDWRAGAWLLEHCQPEHFAKNRLEITGRDGEPIAGQVAVLVWPHMMKDGKQESKTVHELQNNNSAEPSPDAD